MENINFSDVVSLLNDCICTVSDLTDQLNEKNNEIEAIMNLIDLKIKENKELAVIHYPSPEDKYVNEYESRADELEQLKRMILK